MPRKHGDFYSNYGGQTLYKTTAIKQDDSLFMALTKLKNTIQNEGFELGTITLIPDGSDISSERLTRDANLGGFRAKDIDQNYKYTGLYAYWS